MTQEDKQLLLKDLCARLPYGVRARFCDGVKEEMDDVWDIDMFSGAINADYIIDDVRPYLRPMSSMTEEEFHNSPIYGNDVTHSYIIDKDGFHFIKIDTYDNEVLDFLNAHHFDYRNLIGKGLAIDYTDLNIY